jgi:1-acyl-sn-glycerol-3-phosphate acyltransferase
MFYLFIKALSLMLLTVTGGLKVYGKERLPRKGPIIIVANHQSLLDPVALIACLPYRITFLAASYLFKIPVAGLVFSLTGAMPVKSQKGDFGSLKKSLAALERGNVIGLFPEGGVSPDGRLRPLLPGWAYLALKSGAPVLPVIICGSRRVLPVGSFILRPGKICINIGQPFAFPKKDRIRHEDLAELNQKLKQELLKLFDAGLPESDNFSAASKDI